MDIIRLDHVSKAFGENQILEDFCLSVEERGIFNCYWKIWLRKDHHAKDDERIVHAG